MFVESLLSSAGFIPRLYKVRKIGDCLEVNCEQNVGGEGGGGGVGAGVSGRGCGCGQQGFSDAV